MTPWAHQQAPELHGEVYAIGFKRYWRPVLRQFLPARAQIRHVAAITDVPMGAVAVIWGRAVDASQFAEQHNICLFRLEDGFIRSVGLGAQFVKPLSWVIDRQGMYFDATQASDLETLLNDATFCDAELAEAEALITQLNQLKISKYNTGATEWQPRVGKPKQPVILVTGQVESDASIQFGAVANGIRKNIDLLKAVRAAHPDAYLVYKPHPDVLAKARQAGDSEALAHDYCDEVVGDVSLTHMLDEVDEVHVLTSLSGFEALLRGKKVSCYGLPFYAGWGLTDDYAHCARRQRARTLTELVAGALIRYPVYIHPHSNECITAATAVNVLQQQRLQQQQSSQWQRLRHNMSHTLRASVRRILNVVRP